MGRNGEVEVVKARWGCDCRGDRWRGIVDESCRVRWMTSAEESSETASVLIPMKDLVNVQH